MIPGDLLSAFPHRQFHTLPGLLDSWAALPNSIPNAYVPMQGGSLYHFYDGLWYDPSQRQTHDLPCERRTRYRLSQPDTVREVESFWKSLFTFVRRPCIGLLSCVTVSYTGSQLSFSFFLRKCLRATSHYTILSIPRPAMAPPRHHRRQYVV